MAKKVVSPKKPRSKYATMTSQLRTYATNVGYVAFEWNQAQEALGVLFGKILQIRHPAAAATIWHSLPSDRAQRQVLREILDLYYRGDERELLLKTAANPDVKYLNKFSERVIWVLNKIDNKYSNIRNNAIHIPMHFRDQYIDGDEMVLLLPDIGFFNKRAWGACDKDMIEEVKICSLNLNIIWSYITDLISWFDANDLLQPLPETPILQDSIRRNNAKG